MIQDSNPQSSLTDWKTLNNVYTSSSPRPAMRASEKSRVFFHFWSHVFWGEKNLKKRISCGEILTKIVGNPFKTHTKTNMLKFWMSPWLRCRFVWCEIAQILSIDPPIYVPDVLAFRKCWSFLCYVWLVQIISKILFVSRPKSNHTNALDSRV